jgi:hypothetical protein
MKFLKHILVMVALLATMLPCSHAAEHHDHDHGATVELCAFATDPCECHSCDHKACSDDVEIQIDRTSVSKTSVIYTAPAILLPILETKPVLKKTILPVSGILAVIQTVQLLI